MSANAFASKQKILLVEDEAFLSHEIAEALQYENYLVLTAEDGRQGLEIARREMPDLIISDIMMPNLDGYGFLMALREDTVTARIPFIFLTAKSEYADMRKGMAFGADDYLVKPFDILELLTAIRTRLQKRNEAAEAATKEMEALRHSVVTALPHELRTPLTGIMGYVNFIVGDFDSLRPEQVYQMLQGVQRATNRLYRLIQNYLLFTQLEIVGMDEVRRALLFQYRDLQPTNVIEASQSVLAERAENYHRQADVKSSLAPAKLRLLSEDFTKILDEVLDNALKFSPEGTTVSVIGQADSQSGIYTIKVTDNGRGMRPDQVRAIGAMMQFDRKRHEQQGAGLGLAIVRRLIELYGGNIQIESDVQHGCTVILSFPMLGV
ncbi:MAG: response regulator [Anaerolineae bacterium]